jgi:DNA-binding phage protein
MNIRKLKGKMVEKGVSVDTLASDMGMTRSNLYRKLSEKGNLTVRDAQKIKVSLNLTGDEARDIFFSE